MVEDIGDNNKYEYDTKIYDIKYPVKKNTKVGEIKVLLNNKTITKQDLISHSDIDKLNISVISNNKIIYLKKTVRKMIFNRFIHNIFLFIEKGKENTFKIYSVSDKNKNNKNVEVILLNPIFIV